MPYNNVYVVMCFLFFFFDSVFENLKLIYKNSKFYNILHIKWSAKELIFNFAKKKMINFIPWIKIQLVFISKKKSSF